MERKAGASPSPVPFRGGGRTFLPAAPLESWLTRGDDREAAGKGKSSFRSSCPVGVPGWERTNRVRG